MSRQRDDFARRTRRVPRRQWLVPAGLIALAAVPIAAGASRLVELSAGAPVTPENARFVTMPVPVVLHIIGASVYCILGAFQFVPALRRPSPSWHRVAGRIVIPCGLVAALSGLWMSVFYKLPAGDGDLLTAFRITFGSALIASILLGLAAVRRRDFERHRTWMIRGYAIAQGAGTQVLTNVPWILVVGKPGELTRALLMAAGWVINLVVAERIIRSGRNAGRTTGTRAQRSRYGGT